jgi:hypothetical protein
MFVKMNKGSSPSVKAGHTRVLVFLGYGLFVKRLVVRVFQLGL